METATSEPVAMLRLDHDEDVLEAIRGFVSKGESTFVIVAGLGMLHDFELGYFDNGQYVRRRFPEPHELLSMQGSVSSEGENRIHIHVSVADRNHRAFGGHLLAGRVWMSNEIVLLKLAGARSRRELDPAKKVGILHFLE
jgi:predicted DNA-binding protein with PD1-like motif